MFLLQPLGCSQACRTLTEHHSSKVHQDYLVMGDNTSYQLITSNWQLQQSVNFKSMNWKSSAGSPWVTQEAFFLSTGISFPSSIHQHRPWGVYIKLFITPCKSCHSETRSALSSTADFLSKSSKPRQRQVSSINCKIMSSQNPYLFCQLLLFKYTHFKIFNFELKGITMKGQK